MLLSTGKGDAFHADSENGGGFSEMSGPADDPTERKHRPSHAWLAKTTRGEATALDDGPSSIAYAGNSKRTCAVLSQVPQIVPLGKVGATGLEPVTRSVSIRPGTSFLGIETHCKVFGEQARRQRSSVATARVEEDSWIVIVNHGGRRRVVRWNKMIRAFPREDKEMRETD